LSKALPGAPGAGAEHEEQRADAEGEEGRHRWQEAGRAQGACRPLGKGEGEGEVWGPACPLSFRHVFAHPNFFFFWRPTLSRAQGRGQRIIETVMGQRRPEFQYDFKRSLVPATARVPRRSSPVIHTHTFAIANRFAVFLLPLKLSSPPLFLSHRLGGEEVREAAEARALKRGPLVPCIFQTGACGQPVAPQMLAVQFFVFKRFPADRPRDIFRFPGRRDELSLCQSLKFECLSGPPFHSLRLVSPPFWAKQKNTWFGLP